LVLALSTLTRSTKRSTRSWQSPATRSRTWNRRTPIRTTEDRLDK
jgi:hypothetical protein